MKKIFPYILIIMILVNLFAPFSVGNNKNNFTLEKNIALAADELKDTATKDSITITGTITPETDIQSYTLTISDDAETSITSIKLSDILPHTFTGLTPAISYTITLRIIYSTPNKADKILSHVATTLDESGNRDNSTDVTIATTDSSKVNQTPSDSLNYKCGIGGTLAGCVYQFSYLIFRLTGWLFATAGIFFDFTFGYSIQDTSYRMSFITEGWALMRDFVNLFFIFVLLYAAISIIFNLGKGQGRQIIIYVVIIGLLINFSLFATRVIVDASNILAKVFYNSIVITADENTDPLLTTSRQGVSVANQIDPAYKSLSAGLVAKINPQILISQANKVGLTTISGEDQGTGANKVGVGSAILVTLLAIGINIIGMMVFLSVGLIFLARVIGLALAMIFAPLAFFTYTVPSMRNIETVGITKWFSNLISLAFLAPVFIFFLYLIIQFVQSGLGLEDATNQEGIKLVLLIIIPFAFIMILLKQAGSIAKKMSGYVGEAVTSGVKLVGGAALGVGAGTLAMGTRGLIGRAGSAIASSDKLKKAEAKGGVSGFFAKGLLKTGKAAGSSSLDIRGIKIAGKGLGSITGMEKTLGKPKEGGFTKMRADKIVERQKRMKELEVGEDSKLKQELNSFERNLQELLRTNSHELGILDKKIQVARENANDASNQAKVNPTQANKDAAKQAALVLKDLKGEKAAIKSASTFVTSTGRTVDHTNNRIGGKSIGDLENQYIPDAHHAIEKENRGRREDYAKQISSKGSKTMNVIFSLGQYSTKGANEAAHKIRMEAKLDSGNKT